MKKTITFITGNKGKFKEIKAMIPELKNKDIDLPEIQEIDGKKVIEAKLKEAYKTFKQEFIVEDTSLHLNCLNDLPGPLIKWFLKTIGVSGIYDLAKKYNNFKTEAICWIGYIDKKGKITFFDGRTIGKITKPIGSNGFGWDSIFIPDGFTKTLAQMSQEEKNKISMRKIAVNKFKKFYYNKIVVKK